MSKGGASIYSGVCHDVYELFMRSSVQILSIVNVYTRVSRTPQQSNVELPFGLGHRLVHKSFRSYKIQTQCVREFCPNSNLSTQKLLIRNLISRVIFNIGLLIAIIEQKNRMVKLGTFAKYKKNHLSSLISECCQLLKIFLSLWGKIWPRWQHWQSFSRFW